MGSQKVEGLITYSLDQQISKFKAIIGHKDPKKHTDPNLKGSKFNLDELNNREIWGANVDPKSYGKKWMKQFMSSSKIWVFTLQKQFHVSWKSQNQLL